MLLALLLCATTAPTLAGEPIGPMATMRGSHRAATLPDGRVLIVGGSQGDATGRTTNRVEIFDPATKLFTAAAPMHYARTMFGIATLPDGRVLVVGGGDDVAGGASAEVYSPQTGTWTVTAPMAQSRGDLRALALADGKVLILGNTPHITATEVFDPATLSFSPSGPMTVGRGDYTSVVLADQRVLVIGGIIGTFQTSSAEVRDPVTGNWQVISPMRATRWRASATLLQDGKVLIAGGGGSPSTEVAELFDPASNTFSRTGGMVTWRYEHTADLLADGSVMIAGGRTGTNPIDSVEIYDPRRGSWRFSDRLAEPDYYQTSTVLGNGKVLFTGGIRGSGVNAELIDPACAAFYASLSENAHAFDEAGGSTSVTVTIPAGCVWNITEKPGWLAISSDNTGNGSGTVTLTATANTGSAERSATVRIANLDFRVTQAISQVCNASAPPLLTPSMQWVSKAGASFTATVATGNCPWTFSAVPH